MGWKSPPSMAFPPFGRIYVLREPFFHPHRVPPQIPETISPPFFLNLLLGSEIRVITGVFVPLLFTLQLYQCWFFLIISSLVEEKVVLSSKLQGPFCLGSCRVIHISDIGQNISKTISIYNMNIQHLSTAWLTSPFFNTFLPIYNWVVVSICFLMFTPTILGVAWSNLTISHIFFRWGLDKNPPTNWTIIISLWLQMPTSCRWRPSLLATACLVPCLWRLDPVPFRALLVPPRWWREGRVRHDLESFEALESKSELDTLAERNGLGWRLVGWLEKLFFFLRIKYYVLCIQTNYIPRSSSGCTLSVPKGKSEPGVEVLKFLLGSFFNFQLVLDWLATLNIHSRHPWCPLCRFSHFYLQVSQSAKSTDKLLRSQSVDHSKQDHSKQHHITYPNNPVLFYGISHGPELVLLVYKNGCTSHWTSIAY